MAKLSSSNGIAKFPKLRFPEFKEPWKQVRLSDFAQRVVRKNKNNETDLPLTISSKDGLVDQISFFNKTIASKDISNYYLIRNGEFAYNKSYSVGYDFGSIKRLERYPMGALSTLYICFTLTNHNSDYIKTYFDSLKWYKEIYMISAEGARNHGLLNVPTDDFFDTYHYITDNPDEQQKIAAFINLIDQRIQKQQQLLENIKKYKRGALSALFPKKGEITPQYRFAGFTKPWEQRKLGELGTVSMCRRIFKEQTSERGDIPFYKIGTFGGQADAFISIELFEEYKSKYPYPKKGDILISASGSIGRTVEFTGKNEYFQDSNIVWLNHDDRLNNSFLKCFYSVIKWAGIEGSTIKRLYNDNILNTVISLPSVDEQRKIGTFFKELDNFITLHQHKYDTLLTLKNALLQQMFI